MSHISLHTVIISTKFECDVAILILLPSYSILAADMLCDLVTLTFDRLILSSGYMAGHVLNPCTQFEDLMPILSRFVGYEL